MKSARFRFIMIACAALIATSLAVYFTRENYTIRDPELVIATIWLVWATAMLGLSTLFLAVVALDEIAQNRKHSEKALKSAQKQNEDTQHAAYRPIVIPIGVLDLYNQPFTFSLPWTNTGEWLESVNIQNVGPGAALTVRGVLLPPERENDTAAKHAILSEARVLGPGSQLASTFYARPKVFTPDDHITDQNGVYPLFARGSEKQRVTKEESDQAPTVRLTLTYLDVFGVKHASIFDWVPARGWVFCAFPVGIDKDLDELYVEKSALAPVGDAASPSTKA